MDTGEAVIDDSDDECDALFTMDDVLDGTTNTKKQNTDEVREVTFVSTCGGKNVHDFEWRPFFFTSTIGVVCWVHGCSRLQLTACVSMRESRRRGLGPSPSPSCCDDVRAWTSSR